MTTWLDWVVRRASASRTLLATQLILVVVTTGIISGTLGWSDATATHAARAALTADASGVSSVVVRMREGADPAAQDTVARRQLALGFAPAPVTIDAEQEPDPSGGTAFMRWVVTPDIDAILPEHLPALAAGAKEATRLVDEADLTGRGVTVTGDLAPVAEDAAASWSAARALGWVPLAVLALVTVLGVAQVAGLLAAARESEVHLLLARGARPTQLLWSEIAESAAVTALGTAVGTLGAVGALRLLGTPFDDVTAVVSGGLATGALIVATLAVTTGLQIRRTTAGATRSDRIRAVAGAASALAVAVAAAVASWQLLRAGSVVVTGTDGQRSPDLLAAAAPAFLLLAAAVVGLVLLGPVSRLMERGAHAANSASLPLAASQVSRRLSHQGVSVVLTILATGTTTLASLFAGTSAALESDHRQLVGAADVRASISAPVSAPFAPPAFPDTTRLPAVAAAAPVWLDPAARVGDMDLRALAAPLSQLSHVVTLPRGGGLPSLPAPPAGSGSGPIIVPPGTGTVRLQLDASVSLDEWQAQHLRLAYPYGEAVALSDASGELPPEELRQLAVGFAGHFWDAQDAPLQLEPAMFVRDLDSGQSQLVRGEPLTLDPLLVLDEANLRNPGFTPARGALSLEVPLDPSRRHAIDAVHVRLAEPGGFRTLQFSIGIRTGGGQDLTTAAEGWLANYAVPAGLAEGYEAQRQAALPARVEVAVEDFFGFARIRMDSNKPELPPVFEATGSTIEWRGDTAGSEEYRISPSQSFLGQDPLGVTAATPPPTAEPVPVALTPAAARGAQLRPGDRFQLEVLQRGVPAVVAAITEVVPGIDEAEAVILDSAALAAHHAHTSSSLPWPHELWLRTDDSAALVPALERLAEVGEVVVHRPSAAASPAGATAMTFWVASGGAALLALVGVAAATLTDLGQRRPEVAVLRALGMSPRAQARSRALEPVLSLLPAAALGVLTGWGVSVLSVGALASSAVTRTGGLVPQLRFSWPWFALLLAAAAAATVLIFWAASSVVVRQARENTYREEVR